MASQTTLEKGKSSRWLLITSILQSFDQTPAS